MAKQLKKNILIRMSALGAVLAVGILLAACQPAAQPAAQTADQSTQPQGFGGGNGQRPNFQMTPAPEMPAATPAARGVVTKIDGNTLTVQEGGFGFGQGNWRHASPAADFRWHAAPAPDGGACAHHSGHG